jgi:hypothetical protein
MNGLSWRFFVMSCALLAVAVSGCIELRSALLYALTGSAGTRADDGGGGVPDDGNGGQEPDGNDNGSVAPATPRVRLTVSNPVPQLGEQVNLSCTRTDGVVGEEVAYSFMPEGRLTSINEDQGTAILIVDESHIGVELILTCQGTNEAGTGPESTSVSIIPQ